MIMRRDGGGTEVDGGRAGGLDGLGGHELGCFLTVNAKKGTKLL